MSKEFLEVSREYLDIMEAIQDEVVMSAIGNRAAARRARTLTVKLEKLGKHNFVEYEEQPSSNEIYMTFKYRKWGVDANNKPFSCSQVLHTKSQYE